MKRTACILLLMIVSVTCYSEILSDSITISYAERDTIYRRLNDCKELPLLRALVLQQNAALTTYGSLAGKYEAVIDSFKSQEAGYKQLVQTKQEQAEAYKGIVQQQKKQIRRSKIMTGAIIAPVSFLLGGLISIIIVQ